MPLPLPPELFARFERGEIDRDELHRLMATHAREIIEEMEEDYRNPVAAWWETVMARRAMHRLIRTHGSTLIREVLIALSSLDFPAARYLWNAAHPDVPLACFLRMKKTPVFRLLALRQSGNRCVVTIETTAESTGMIAKHSIVLVRDATWALRPESGS